MKRFVCILLVVLSMVLFITPVGATSPQFSETGAPDVSVSPSTECNVGDTVTLKCTATATDGSELSYLWYESDDGSYMYSQAYNRGSETSSTFKFKAEYPGDYFFYCSVSTSAGGFRDSKKITVTVFEKPAVEVSIETNKLPAATVGEAYSATIKCTDPDAEIGEYYNPGKSNDFGKTGLKLSKNGKISGTPKAAGKFTFTVCAAGMDGEDYATYTLVVNEAPAVSETPATPEPSADPVVTDEPIDEPAAEPDEPIVIAPAPDAAKPEGDGAEDGALPAEPVGGTTGAVKGGLPWWAIVLIALGAAAVGAAVVVVILVVTNKKRNSRHSRF